MELGAGSGGIGELRERQPLRHPAERIFFEKHRKGSLPFWIFAYSLSLHWMSKSRLLRRIETLTESAVPGTLVEVMLRCGKASCGCSTDPERRHGPHLYLKFRDENGRSTSLYIPRSYERDVRRGAEAWSKLQQAVRDLGQVNRQALSKRLRERHKS